MLLIVAVFYTHDSFEYHEEGSFSGILLPDFSPRTKDNPHFKQPKLACLPPGRRASASNADQHLHDARRASLGKREDDDAEDEKNRQMYRERGEWIDKWKQEARG